MSAFGNMCVLGCGLAILQVALTALFLHRVRKILNLRVFEDESGKHWSKSVMDKEYEVLCVSQFTLQCVLKGNKPDFHLAMPTEQAESFYNSFLEQLRKSYRPELIRGRLGLGRLSGRIPIKLSEAQRLTLKKRQEKARSWVQCSSTKTLPPLQIKETSDINYQNVFKGLF